MTTPATFVPPESAETRLVLTGTGSVIFTPFAEALPSFLTVSVYVMLLDGPTGLSSSTFDSTSAGTASASEILYAPRPWVPAASSRMDEARSS